MSESGAVTTEPYDKLVLSPGAPSIRPQLARYRSPWHLPRSNRTGRPDHPRMDFGWNVVPDRDVPLHRDSDGESRTVGPSSWVEDLSVLKWRKT